MLISWGLVAHVLQHCIFTKRVLLPMLEEFENREDRLATLSDSVYIFSLLNRRRICLNALAIVIALGNLLRALQNFGLNGAGASAQALWHRVNLLAEGLRTTGGKDVRLSRLRP